MDSGMTSLTELEFGEVVASIRSRPAVSVSGVWFNLARYGGWDFAQGDVLDDETGMPQYRPIAVLSCGTDPADIAGLWPSIEGHPVERTEEALLVEYLSARDGRDVELLVPERCRAGPVKWGRFDESSEFRVYTRHIHPKILDALDRVDPACGDRGALACEAGLQQIKTERPGGRDRLLDLGCGCGDLIEAIKCHYCRKRYEGRQRRCRGESPPGEPGGRIPDFDFFGIDCNPDNVFAAESKRGGRIVEGDCRQLDTLLSDGLDFDVIVCCGLLNRQVTTRKEALDILEQVHSRLRSGGHIIVTGYTACHLSADDFSLLGIEVLQKSIPENLFKPYRDYHLRQFYVGRKR